MARPTWLVDAMVVILAQEGVAAAVNILSQTATVLATTPQVMRELRHCWLEPDLVVLAPESTNACFAAQAAFWTPRGRRRPSRADISLLQTLARPDVAGLITEDCALQSLAHGLGIAKPVCGMKDAAAVWRPPT